MGRYTNALKIVMGIAMPLMIPANYLTEKFLKTGHKEVAHAIDKEAVKGVMCGKVKDLLYYEVGDVTWEYVKSHPSSIGTDCYKNREMICAAWLKGYYKWLADRALDELPSVEEMPETPKLPKMPEMPSLPSLKLPGADIAKDIKKGVQVTGLVVMGFIALIVYLMFVRGRGVTVVK